MEYHYNAAKQVNKLSSTDIKCIVIISLVGSEGVVV